MSEQLRQAIRDGRMIREGRRAIRRSTTAIVNPDRPQAERRVLKDWIARELEA